MSDEVLACEVPFTELLRAVPISPRHVEEYSYPTIGARMFPTGHYCRRAANEIERLTAERDAADTMLRHAVITEEWLRKQIRTGHCTECGCSPQACETIRPHQMKCCPDCQHGV